MKILFDHQIFQTQKYGGISRYYKEVLPELRGVEIDLFEGLSINQYKLSGIVNSHFYLKTPEFLASTSVYTKLNRIAFPIYAALKKPKILHHTYYRDTDPFFRGLRTTTYYDSTHELFPNCFKDGDPTIDWKKATLPKADHIFCISESSQKDLINHYGINPEKTSVALLANPLPWKGLQPRPIPDRYILFVGNRDAYKNFSVLAKALSSSTQLKTLNLVCFGGPAFSTRELQEIDALGLKERLEHRKGGDLEAAAFYQHAEVFVFPSLYEGFGLPALEAMAQSCPVIGHSAGSSPEICGKAAVLINMESVLDLKTAMEAVFLNNELRKSLISEGKKQESRFSWTKCANAHSEIFKKLASRVPP